MWTSGPLARSTCSPGGSRKSSRSCAQFGGRTATTALPLSQIVTRALVLSQRATFRSQTWLPRATDTVASPRRAP